MLSASRDGQGVARGTGNLASARASDVRKFAPALSIVSLSPLCLSVSLSRSLSVSPSVSPHKVVGQRADEGLRLGMGDGGLALGALLLHGDGEGWSGVAGGGRGRGGSERVLELL